MPPRDEDEWLNPQYTDWSTDYRSVYEDLASGTTALNDRIAQELFDAGFVSMDYADSGLLNGIRESLSSYLMSEYGIDFDDVFDWDAWREAYGTE